MDLLRKLRPHHLRLVVRIADSGKLQVAAAALAMSQPAASRTLSEIETDVGAKLFERHPKGMQPTPSGEAFIRHARAALNALESLEAEVGGINLGRAGKVRVGSVTGPAAHCVVPALLKIKETSPDLETSVEVGPSRVLMRGLEAGQFDFILGRLPPGRDSRDFHIQPARAEVVSLMVSPSHPLAERREVALAELTGYPWVIQERGSPIRTAVEQAFVTAGLTAPRNIVSSASLMVMLALIERSDTLAPVSEEVANLLIHGEFRARLGIIDLSEPIRVSPYFVIHRRSQRLSRAAERLMHEVMARL